jgi:lipopolysaccharide export system permease protein
MLKTLDKYIIKKYIGTFLFTVLLITMVSVVIDFSEKIAKFLDQPLTAKQIIFDYYLPFIPWINGLLWPLFALIAVIFFTSRMARNSEIISILNAGVSFRRMMVPYFIAGLLISLALWGLNNFVIPKSSKLKIEFESEYLRKSQRSTLSYDVHFFLEPNAKVYIRYYRERDSSAQTFRLEKYQDGNLSYLLKANRLKLKEPPNVWTLKDYEIRTIDGLNETLLVASGKSMDTTFNFTPKDFIRYSKQMEMMTSRDLVDFIEIEKSRGLGQAKKFQIELHRRTADPVTVLILTLIGVAVASRKVRGGMGFHLAIGIILGAGFVVLSKFAVTFANNLSLSPGLGVWTPNIFFSFVALFLAAKAQK